MTIELDTTSDGKFVPVLLSGANNRVRRARDVTSQKEDEPPPSTLFSAVFSRAGMRRTKPTIVISGRWLLARCCLGLLLASGSAQAMCPVGPGSSVNVTYIDTMTTRTFEVFDGGPLDLNPNSREIFANFEFGATVPPPQPWVANGTVKAISNADGFAETLLTNVLIENVGGPVSDVQIIAEHCFDNQITIPMSFDAPVDGALLNTANGIINARAELLYFARVNGVDLSGSFTETHVGQGPFPFAHLLGPTSVEMLPPRASQAHWLRFYLDGTGDAIRLDNSALIQPAIPGLSVLSMPSILTMSALLLVAGFGALLVHARMRPAR